MKNCTHCKYAEWKRTADGKLNPSGYGMCTVEVKIPPLPASMYWTTPPYARGGVINRNEDFKKDCAYFERMPKEIK